MIEIRPPRPEDVAPLTQAVNLPGVRMGTLRFPFTGEDVMRERLLDPASHAKPLVATWQERAVGQGSLFLKFGRQRHVGEIFLFVHDDYWGRGIGRALLAALLDLADNWHGLRRVELDVATENARAIAMYKAAGFEIEGTKRGDTITAGRLDDSHVMGRLQPAPERDASGLG
ncbi:MAG: GNAT family N-acetyltransferase [Pseudomonadota bacterium]